MKIKAKNYIPGSMSFSAGFFVKQPSDADFQMFVDENKAHDIINEISKTKTVESAELGLDGDWELNNTEIYRDGRFYKYESYGESHWAEPILIVYFADNTNECYSCWYREVEVN